MRLPGLALPTYQLEDRGGYRNQWSAEIEIHSWDCLLMIARLIAEDRKAWQQTHPQPKEEVA